MKRNRYTVCYRDDNGTTVSVKCVSISDAKSYISGNRDIIYRNTDTVNIYRGREVYGSYILYNGCIIEVKKGDFR